MARDFSRDFYNSAKWQRCRAAYIAHRRSVDGGLCEECHEKMGYIVHHRAALTPENINDPDIALGFGNLKYVCLDCHNEEHNSGQIKGMVKYIFCPDGDVIPVCDRVCPPDFTERMGGDRPQVGIDLTRRSV